MGKLESARMYYEEIEIPKELTLMVNRTIEQSRVMQEHQKKTKASSYGRTIGKAVSAAAVVVVVFAAALNTSSTFAAAVKDMPVIGGAARVLTFRTYGAVDSDKKIHENIPGVTVSDISVKERAFSDEVNQSIQEKCDAYLTDAIERVKEYKEAFIATGGTEAEFTAKNIEISVDYEVMNQSNDTVSFVVRGMENWVSAYGMSEYYNLDLNHMKYLSLSDVLGEDYVTIANESVREQIRQREEADENVIFWTKEEGGFDTVDENTHFYIDSKGHPVLVFEKYEIAPGAMGEVEFVITR